MSEHLLHDCGDDQRLRTRPTEARRRRGGGRVIDLHCHFLNTDVETMVAALPDHPPLPTTPPTAVAQASAAYNAELMQTVYRPKLTDLSVRLADMDAMGVDIQAISPSPTQYYYWTNGDASRVLVKSINETIAAACADHPDRLIGLGTVSLQDPSLAAEQARYAVRTLGLRGIEISSLVDGVAVDDRRFDPFWAAMEELDAVVLLHPLGTTIGPRVDPNYLSNVVGQPAETAITLSRMIFGGHFDRFEKIKLCAVHGGGYLPLYIGRSDHAYAVRPESCGCRRKPSDYLRRIWFDTVVYDPAHLRALIRVVGAGKVVVGTDYPFDMGDYDPVGLIEAVEDLSEAERSMILGGNARELLGLTS